MDLPQTAFEFATAGKIIFGSGTINRLGELASSFGEKALFVCGRNRERIAPIITLLHDHTIKTELYQVEGEPSVGDVEKGVQSARKTNCSMVIAVGGGSVIDSGKAIAALLTNPGSPLDYLEVIGQGQILKHNPAPFIAIPTTSGTGAEVTANAVLESPEHRVKVSLRHTMMLADLALIDPELTLSLSPRITAHTGLDALTQVLEPFVSRYATPMTDLLCREGLRLAARSLVRAYVQGDDLGAREDMALVSLYGGLALANAKLGAVHGIAGPFGGMYSAPHGAVCAALLPHVMRVNIKALIDREPSHFALQRYREIAVILTGDSSADALDGPKAVNEITNHFAIGGLAEYGLIPEEKDLLIQKALRASSMKGNPLQLSHMELAEIIEAAC